MAGRHDEAAEKYQRAIDLNLNFAAAHGCLGWVLGVTGKSDEGIPHIEKQYA